jgi:hypothetical protein
VRFLKTGGILGKLHDFFGKLHDSFKKLHDSSKNGKKALPAAFKIRLQECFL